MLKELERSADFRPQDQELKRGVEAMYLICARFDFDFYAVSCTCFVLFFSFFFIWEEVNFSDIFGVAHSSAIMMGNYIEKRASHIRKTTKDVEIPQVAIPEKNRL